ncbi:hypothetical protein C5167_048162 [Papaver somniferum]|uniref:WRC domain-containing protein n=1 Tax=Papaver somniferum TaxID=3469 RepID=A0A4Y7KL48_PAPSO|nr:uncharacterized protein LOC113301403 [Papaver somniferum]RZC72679.1 hypothetical protein C5167_048162 [Papaver somniferum]
MRIRKLISQKKISAPNPSSNNLSSSVSSIPSSCPAAAATSTVSTSTTGLKEKEADPVNILQKHHVGVCELNMSVWDVTADDELLYYRKDEEISKVIKNEDKEEKDYHDEDKIPDESVDTEEYRISTEEDDSGSEEDDHEETDEEEELKEEQNATENNGTPGLKPVIKDDDDKKRKRDYEENHIESEEDIEETEVDNEGKLGLKSEKKKKKKLESDSDPDYDGKRWHCRSKAQTGNPLCEHHMIQMERYSDHHYRQRKLANKGIVRPPKESRTSTVDTTTNRVKRSKSKRGRPSNKGKLSGGKSSEFYYYPGFGPLWGKSKRGRPSDEVKKQPDSEENLDEEKQVIIDEALITTHGISPVKVTEDNGCIMFVDDEFDDDYNTDEDCNGVNGKTKNRKPIKARSLNSLF